jgi:hypothetical protein
MSGKMSPAAQVKLANFERFVAEVGRINALVEQFAVAKTGQDNIKAMIKRQAAQSKLKFMTTGLAQLSQNCAAIELAAARSGSQGAQARTLRELVGQLKFQIDFEIRTVLREDADEQARKKKEKEA